MKDAILVTGATGFIGRHLVRRLCELGLERRLRLLVRDPLRARALGLPDGALRQGTLEELGEADPAWSDVGTVIHLAGLLMALRADDLHRVNAAGTTALLRSVPPRARVLLVSSLAAAGPSIDGEGSALPPDLCRPVSRYGRSKLDGERALVDDAARTGRGWLVFRPGLVYGPGDPATALLWRQATAAFTPVPAGPRPLSVIHARDVCAALVLALERPLASQRTLPLEGPVRTTTHELARAIAAAAGRRARLIPVPAPVVRLAGRMADAVARVRGRPNLFSADKAAEITARGWVADPEPAREVLGFRPGVSLGDGLAELAAGR